MNSADHQATKTFNLARKKSHAQNPLKHPLTLPLKDRLKRIIIIDEFPSRNESNPLKCNITSVAHPLFVAECVQGLPSPAQLVQATISFGPLCSFRFSPCKDINWTFYLNLKWKMKRREIRLTFSTTANKLRSNKSIDLKTRLMHAKCFYNE